MVHYKIEHHSKNNGRFITTFICNQINSYSLNYWLLICSTNHQIKEIEDLGIFFIVKTIKTEKLIKTIKTKELLKLNNLMCLNRPQNYKDANDLLNN